ncbi:MAG TPA: protein-disulfide reductase DsbD domain-containing protein, partial [Candidatus Binataceae bacterium]|nr:protein-disulfide reductase DsbD domain-containing protein [Candidatus Binataceae bacterium]
MERTRPSLEKHGLNVASISYDPTETLARFSNAYNIGYPMLSDRDSVVIKKFGILNTNVPEGHMFFGIPFPTDYLVTPQRLIGAKYATEDYQTRVASSEILLDQFGEAPGSSATVRAADVEVTIALSADHAAAGQQLGVSANFNIAPGWHIYGQPIASNYTATAITLEGDAAGAQSMQFPKPEMVKFEALGETLPVYKGSFKATGMLMIKPGTKPGDYTLAGTVKFQECNDSICKMPQSASFTLA